ncbi:reverse transcriptase domain, reverse transcriptase zinc-binding domain protein [Tanacetum coccineum]
MRQMGFGAKWRKWIGACLSSASILVLINGSPSKEFKMERGLRQGDPLSPLLFLLVGEALQVAILEACNKGMFKGISLSGEEPNLSLLQYADDALFFGEWSRLNASNLIHILKCFEGSSCLKVNISKSRIFGIGVCIADVDQVAGSLGCAFDQIPFMYLGLPVGKSMRSCGGWNGVVDMFNARLSAWNAKNLSIGGRLTLVKSVLGNLSIYFLSLFKAPQKIIDRLEAIRRRLGVGSIGAKNLSLLAKWKWRFLTETNALWRIVIKSFYGDEGGFGSLAYPAGNKGVWYDITKVVSTIEALFPAFKHLFQLKRFALRGRAVSDLNTLLSVIGDYALDGSRDDSWTWTGDVSGLFKAKPLATCVQNYLFSGLPTRLNLFSHGVSLPSYLCLFCDTEIEDIGHCLISCPKVVLVWRKIWSWWGLPLPTYFPSFSIKDIALGKIGSYSFAKTCKALHGVFQCALWSIWKWRNKVVNAHQEAINGVKKEDIFPFVQRISKD